MENAFHLKWKVSGSNLDSGSEKFCQIMEDDNPDGTYINISHICMKNMKTGGT